LGVQEVHGRDDNGWFFFRGLYEDDGTLQKGKVKALARTYMKVT